MSYKGSPYYDQAIDGGYRGDEAEQVAAALEAEHRSWMGADDYGPNLQPCAECSEPTDRFLCDECEKPDEPPPKAELPAELDELLAELPCRDPKKCERWREFRGDPPPGHDPDCPAFYLPALRRHLAAWLAAKGAEAELLREALGMDTPHPVHDVLHVLRKAAQHLLAMHDCDCQGYERIGVAAEASRELEQGIAAALARPRPSASGLLGLLSTMRERSEVVRDDPHHALGEELSAILSDWSDALATAIGLPEEEDDG